MNRLKAGCLAIALTVFPVADALAHGGASGPPSAAGSNAEHRGPRRVKVKINVTSKGFEPSIVRVHDGDRLTLLITRKTDNTCAKEILIPSLGTNEELPLGKTVRVYLGPQQAGRIAFACGMGMYKGVILVQD